MLTVVGIGPLVSNRSMSTEYTVVVAGCGDTAVIGLVSGTGEILPNVATFSDNETLYRFCLFGKLCRHVKQGIR